MNEDRRAGRAAGRGKSGANRAGKGAKPRPDRANPREPQAAAGRRRGREGDAAAGRGSRGKALASGGQGRGRKHPQAGPEIPAHITADQLDASVRAELRTLPRDLADRVARHLAAGDQATDPELAFQHAARARRLAARVGVLREACGVAAYLAGHWAEALSELRAARRLTGRPGYLAIMADCERALGRPGRALALVTGPEAAAADRGEQIELRIVESGIRRDMGATDAAVVVLQVPELTEARLRPWSARLCYAYADALLAAGHGQEAREWFGRASAADPDGETDAAERFEELDDVTIEDLGEVPCDDLTGEHLADQGVAGAAPGDDRALRHHPP